MEVRFHATTLAALLGSDTSAASSSDAAARQADHHDDICRQLAGPREQRFDGLCFTVTEEGAVLLKEAVATFDVSVHEEIEAGDHVIVLLRIHEVGTGNGRHPLVFHKSGFAKLHRDDIDPTRLDGRINGADVQPRDGEGRDADAA